MRDCNPTSHHQPPPKERKDGPSHPNLHSPQYTLHNIPYTISWHWNCCRCDHSNTFPIPTSDRYKYHKKDARKGWKESHEATEDAIKNQGFVLCAECNGEVCAACDGSAGMKGWIERGSLRAWLMNWMDWKCYGQT